MANESSTGRAAAAIGRRPTGGAAEVLLEFTAPAISPAFKASAGAAAVLLDAGESEVYRRCLFAPSPCSRPETIAAVWRTRGLMDSWPPRL
eukprot:9841717-Alexandrium_andersonii.AAC.1